MSKTCSELNKCRISCVVGVAILSFGQRLEVVVEREGGVECCIVPREVSFDRDLPKLGGGVDPRPATVLRLVGADHQAAQTDVSVVRRPTVVNRHSGTQIKSRGPVKAELLLVELLRVGIRWVGQDVESAAQLVVAEAGGDVLGQVDPLERVLGGFKVRPSDVAGDVRLAQTPRKPIRSLKRQV